MRSPADGTEVEVVDGADGLVRYDGGEVGCGVGLGEGLGEGGGGGGGGGDTGALTVTVPEIPEVGNWLPAE